MRLEPPAEAIMRALGQTDMRSSAFRAGEVVEIPGLRATVLWSVVLTAFLSHGASTTGPCDEPPSPAGPLPPLAHGRAANPGGWRVVRALCELEPVANASSC